MLKPIDIVVFIGLLLHKRRGERWTQSKLAMMLKISQASIHRALKQLDRSGLWRAERPQLNAFMKTVEALRVVYPAALGASSRGVRTVVPATRLGADLTNATQYVWPLETGEHFGTSLKPLHPCVPKASIEDPEFHELMALLDVYRVGRVREQRLARERLGILLEGV